MRSPFLGMDPYLESPDVRPDVHTRLMTVFAEQLAPALAPKYVAELDTQLVIDRSEAYDVTSTTEYALPDVAVATLRESAMAAEEPATAVESPRLKVPMGIPVRLVSVYVRLRENAGLVTVIELLPPVNKRPGQGRQDYLHKRESFLGSPVHLVELDLLRKWPRMPFEGYLPKCDYLAVVSSFYERPHCDVWPISVRQPLPDLPISLLKPDPPVTLDLNAALRTTYERARYDLRIDYSKPPDPPLSEADAAWAERLIAQLSAA